MNKIKSKWQHRLSNLYCGVLFIRLPFMISSNCYYCNWTSFQLISVYKKSYFDKFIMGLDILGFAYAATVAAGGIMGYAKAGIFFINKIEQDVLFINIFFNYRNYYYRLFLCWHMQRKRFVYLLIITLILLWHLRHGFLLLFRCIIFKVWIAIYTCDFQLR